MSSSDSSSTASFPPPPQPQGEIIPTTDYLMYGETIYLKVGGKQDRWLNGGRGDVQEDVYSYAKSSSGDVAISFRWTIMQSRTEVGMGFVHYGDKISLKVGSDYDLWLTGGREPGTREVYTRNETDATWSASYTWTVKASKDDTGTGKVQRGAAVWLEVADTALYLNGGRGDKQQAVYTYDGSDGPAENYAWTLQSVGYSKTFAIFSEDSPENLEMKSLWSPRVFRITEALSPEKSIKRDEATGKITLPKGTYRLQGFSIVTYFTGTEPPEKMTCATDANAGCCRIRFFDKPATPIKDSIAVGSLSNANCIPSIFDTVFTTPDKQDTVDIVLEHCQDVATAAADPQVLLRLGPPYGTTAHYMARLAIYRL